jgi:hypothetical protein
MSNPITDLKHELLAAAERQHRQPAVPAERSLRTRVPRPRLLVTAATLAITAGIALFVTAPWGGSGSPDFLAKAQAALTPPTGTVLHEKWQDTISSTDPACTSTRDNEIWVEETPPHRYRALVPLPSLPGSSFCSSAKTVEIGGTLDSHQQLMFVPPNTLSATGPTLQFPSDPVQTLRDALRAGKAVDEGQTQLDGQTVEHIRIGDTSVYVDPQTFYPVETDGHAIFGAAVLQSVSHVLAYDYLPGTTANLALTNIQAQHPNATISR